MEGFPFLQGGGRPRDPEPIRGRGARGVRSEDTGVYWGQLRGPRLKVLGEGVGHHVPWDLRQGELTLKRGEC